MARPGIETPPTPKHKQRSAESRSEEARKLRKQKRPAPQVDENGNLVDKVRSEKVKILSPEERGGKKAAPAKKAEPEPTKDSFDDSVSAETDKLPEKPKAKKSGKKGSS